jgi:hypothetical protein
MDLQQLLKNLCTDDIASKETVLMANTPKTILKAITT